MNRTPGPNFPISPSDASILDGSRLDAEFDLDPDFDNDGDVVFNDQLDFNSILGDYDFTIPDPEPGNMPNMEPNPKLGQAGLVALFPEFFPPVPTAPVPAVAPAPVPAPAPAPAPDPALAAPLPVSFNFLRRHFFPPLPPPISILPWTLPVPPLRTPDLSPTSADTPTSELPPTPGTAELFNPYPTPAPSHSRTPSPTPHPNPNPTHEPPTRLRRLPLSTLLDDPLVLHQQTLHPSWPELHALFTLNTHDLYQHEVAAEMLRDCGILCSLVPLLVGRAEQVPEYSEEVWDVADPVPEYLPREGEDEQFCEVTQDVLGALTLWDTDRRQWGRWGTRTAPDRDLDTLCDLADVALNFLAHVGKAIVHTFDKDGVCELPRDDFKHLCELFTGCPEIKDARRVLGLVVDHYRRQKAEEEKEMEMDIDA